MMTLDIVEVDNMIVSGTVLIIIEDLLPAVTDLVVMENISLQVVEFGGNFPGWSEWSTIEQKWWWENSVGLIDDFGGNLCR